ncbi:unnamed protein product [Parascedosporium putredinis]|uniref:Conserved Oligomeric Golgi complex subunit 6 C-terminal domain-containing protein n=1 Tax=Parascedosporium putredinis TaxID=1442378 RepID=A0A9P1H0Y1_9PEZI|nr:unnamed protein product [Parascedosporium putredinis]CAI7994592.1 unnamed protein product [Parascedosporium putredinis]
MSSQTYLADKMQNPIGWQPSFVKINAVLSTSFADGEFGEVLSTIDELELVNTPITRRQFRLQLQKGVIESNGEVVKDFSRVAEILHDQQYMSPVLQDASSLINEIERSEAKGDLLRRVIRHFTLSEEEINVLTLSSEPIDESFFLAISKAKAVQQDCEVLLGFENQTLGLDVMGQSSKHLDQAFQKLYKWTLRAFRETNLELPQMGPSIRRALRLLSERPPLFQSCLESFSSNRDQILSDAFYFALTGEIATLVGKQTSVKPIEMGAHDPLRYAGDMLAWTHSAAVGEKESLDAVFSPDRGQITQGYASSTRELSWPDYEPAAYDPTRTVRELVDRNLAGVSRMLRQRVEQAIHTNEDIISAYKLINLQAFYRLLFSKLLDADCALTECLQSLESTATRQFRSLVRDQIGALQTQLQQTPHNLETPVFLRDALGQVDTILKTFNASFDESLDRAADLDFIFTEALDPFLAGCEALGNRMTPEPRAIFLINCRLATIKSLQSFNFTQEKVNQLQASVVQDITILEESQLSFFLRGSGVEAIFNAVDAINITPEVTQQAALFPISIFEPEALISLYLGDLKVRSTTLDFKVNEVDKVDHLVYGL